MQDRTCELTKTFNDELHSVAIHPSGLLLLLGLADKLRLMTVLMEDLKQVGALMRLPFCILISFAKHYFYIA